MQFPFCGLFLFHLFSSALAWSLAKNSPLKHVLVVGKVIIDEYGKPEESNCVLSIGGGGPQAALGAALALASLDDFNLDPPKKQPVTFLGPVGGDWTESEDSELESILGPAVQSIDIIREPNFKTPRIRLWHDESQNMHWKPVHDSFGKDGADGLWASKPTAGDVLSALKYSESICCHVILEGGINSPGKGNDAIFLHDINVKKRLSYLGLEPIAFGDEVSKKLTLEDSDSLTSRLEMLRPSLQFISPDSTIYNSLPRSFWDSFDVAVRLGPNGSMILRKGHQTQIYPASLETPNKEPVNPTGAGNAYAGAMTALLAQGMSIEDAACIASAIGAVFCEYSHLPPWTRSVIQRVKQATLEIQEKSILNRGKAIKDC